MSTTQENSVLNSELARLAGKHIEISQQVFGITFDYSEESLQQLDAAIAKFHPDGNVLESTLLPYGAYVGETVRRLLGGVWVQDERGVALLQRIGGMEASASPFSWVQERFSGGMQEPIAGKFESLKQQLGQTGVRISAPAQPAAVTPNGGEGEISDAEAEALARAPLLAFVLVAAADGKVDKKEVAAFEKVIGNVMITATPLLRYAMTVLLPNLEAHLAEVCQRNPVEDLRAVAAILDAEFPDEAEAFKHGVVAIAVQIAESSGGFLGFGSKISKDEGMAIAGIAIALGLELE
jgi:tellurite resistance protein